MEDVGSIAAVSGNVMGNRNGVISDRSRERSLEIALKFPDRRLLSDSRSFVKLLKEVQVFDVPYVIPGSNGDHPANREEKPYSP